VLGVDDEGFVGAGQEWYPHRPQNGSLRSVALLRALGFAGEGFQFGGGEADRHGQTAASLRQLAQRVLMVATQRIRQQLQRWRWRV
jgi:hypothetical protein